jgi:YjbE family integral membrane protein
MTIDSAFLIGLIQIIGIDILLSGDNAVVIALACRSLPKKQQKWGIVFGTGAAVLLRIIFTVFVTALMEVPYLKMTGGLLLFWVAYHLLKPEDESKPDIKAAGSLLGAVRTIVVADAVMALDNVVAIAAAAKGNYFLLIFGLAASIPLVVFGATVLIRLIERFPIIVTMGAALIGFIAGEVIIKDPAIADWVDTHAHWLHYGAPAGGALLVVAAGRLMRRRNSEQEA